jgi:hypothetical protein
LWYGNKASLHELKQHTQPYLFFWEEWTRHEECFLEKDEIELVSRHLKHGFKLPLFGRFRHHYQPEHICRVSRKLQRNYPIFQEWVIFNFLCLLIRMGESYHSGNFLNDPIRELRLPEELKLNLKAFQVNRIGQLGHAYKAIDLKRSWVYDNILDFHRLNRKYDLSCKTTFHPRNLHKEKLFKLDAEQ